MCSKRKDNKVKMKCKKTQSDRNCRNSFINSLAKRFLSKATSFIITQGVIYSRSLTAAKNSDDTFISLPRLYQRRKDLR